ncbi:hypothetical protein AGMMS50267_02040 [Spirochaetia bacterium]|nr:hypothetical protein AGMMS50267_02040 [Spirochaetia bacterium]
MRKLGGVLLSLIFITAGCSGAEVSTEDAFRLSESKLNRLSLEAMAGNGDAAWRISNYYQYGVSYTVENVVLGLEWAMIAAENGSQGGQWETGRLISFPVVGELPTRAVFWMRLVTKNGSDKVDKKASDMAKWELNHYGISPDFDFPPDSSFPASYTDLPAETISACEESALQGSSRAALLLAQYYGNAAGDTGLLEYWYRIGAQNGNAECQYNLGLIYQAKPEDMHKVRGTFWLNKAAENGYVAP